ncbi:uncharacterized protein LOC131018211 [Salvia miltiorrhiza]|uniref:uncharacterized protein LOC131018211 n=1 Tax=Salvia miltiorrhiza TaxID=226208 RepID=UPI0025ABE936|nr:uncharacterized protein LOC131018211 [Salvia miltiorrhiza]
MVRGSVDQHYEMINNYVAELRRVDPDGRYELLLQSDNVFKAFYMGLSPLRVGFKASCRPVIGIDGCFLKTYLGGHLLCATGKYGNNGMFPIAWAVVESENETCWNWFLQILCEELQMGDGTGWTFISDQQKGLQNAVAALAPEAEHRNCARHIYMNWKKVHKGQTLKNLFFRAVYATFEAEFKLAVQDLMDESPPAFEDFMARDTSKFCKAFISTHPKSDSVDNNISECFNGYILNARGKHVIHMLEEIRSSLMVRQVEKFKNMSSVKGRLTPNIAKLLEKNGMSSAYCIALPALHDSFQVQYEGDTFIVHVKTGTSGENKCSCREWDLTGIPCKHALAAIKYMELDPINFVSECFTVQKYLSGYEHGIRPTHGPKMWPQVEGPIVKPPPKTKMPGRPKKKRVRAPEEKDGRMTKHGVMMTCSNCKQHGHNKRLCKNEAVIIPQGEKRRRGRPSKQRAGGPNTNNAPVSTQSTGNKAKSSNKKGNESNKKGNESQSKRKSSHYKGQGAALKGIGVYINEETGNSFYHGSSTSKKVTQLHKYKKPRRVDEGVSSSQKDQPSTNEIPTQESRDDGGPTTQDL